MPKTTKIMARNPKPSIHAELAKNILKQLKIKQKGEMPRMRGGCGVCTYLEKQKGGALNPKSKKELTKMLNVFMRELRADQKVHQTGGGKVSAWFKNTFASPKAMKFYRNFAKGFKIGWNTTAKIAEPILGAASLAFPALAPVAGGVSIYNQLAN